MALAARQGNIGMKGDPKVVELRRLFDQTIALFDKATNPLVSRAGPAGFGRKATNQSFGRI